jgi:hypothetical protein
MSVHLDSPISLMQLWPCAYPEESNYSVAADNGPWSYAATLTDVVHPVGWVPWPVVGLKQRVASQFRACT